MQRLLFFSGLFAILLFAACTTEPIIPEGGIPVIPPIQDPGTTTDNECPDGVISFQFQVLPLMISSCAYSGCHDAISHEEGVVLDSYEKILREVRPGNPNNSDLYESITENGDDIMPPPPAARLTSEQITMIRTWIQQGAENTDCGTPCDPQAFAFAADIQPLLENYCVGCHNGSRQEGGVNLSSHANILPYVNNGGLMATIRGDQYYPIMPPTGSRFSDCRIEQIQNWINDGAPNN